MRDQWDGAFGHLGLVFQSLEGLAVLGFASFEHYCCERLGWGSGRSSSASRWSGKLHDFPSLRQRWAMGGFL